MTVDPRALALTLLASLLAACPGAERSDFAYNVDDDDAAVDDDDAAVDDDDSVDFDPSCRLTVDGRVLAQPAGALTSLSLTTFKQSEVDANGFPTGGTGIENLEVADAQFPFQYRLCGSQEGTVVLGFLFEPNTDLCQPGNLFGALFIDPTSELGLTDQDVTIDRVLGPDDCNHSGDPPPQ